MDTMRMESPNMTAQNVEKIGELFPNCITETVDKEKSTPEKTVYKKAINFEILKQMLSGDVIEGSEAYEFTWVGKKAAIVEANRPIRKTLRPCKEDSVNWDTTENLYIEGDNLEVLKLLQESYLGAIKLIYIDPPYNTGSDFIYRDDFKQSAYRYEDDLGMYDEEGNRMFKNTDSNGRFHSDWCSMIYSRLMLARNLLTEDGVIFISIDDHEQQNMKKIADEVFGEDNFLAQVIWERAYAPVNLKKHFSESHDYIICYAKKIENVYCNGLPKTSEAMDRYKNPDNDPRGVWKAADATVGPAIPDKVYPFTLPSGRVVEPSSGRCWLYNREKFQELINDNRVWFGPDGNSAPSIKKFASEVKSTMTPMTIWKYTEVGHSQDASKKLMQLFDGKSYFDYPKSVDLVKRCIQLYSSEDCYVLDFFAGSATTAHSVMQLNAEDGGKRKFIMVQLPEETDTKSEACKAGYENICEIGKERIRRAGKKIVEENPLMTQNLDTGFRVFKLDETNMNDVYYSADEYSQEMLAMLESNVKADRTDLDLLFGCLLEWGLPLSLPYTSETIEGCTIHTYDPDSGACPALIACFDENIPDSVIKTIAKRQPLRAVFRDSSFANSPSKINVGEVFKLLAPETSVKVI